MIYYDRDIKKFVKSLIALTEWHIRTSVEEIVISVSLYFCAPQILMLLSKNIMVRFSREEFTQYDTITNNETECWNKIPRFRDLYNSTQNFVRGKT